MFETYGSWSINAHGYLEAKPNKIHISFHRTIIGHPPQTVDHINLNRLDNRRENLRLCTAQQNLFNRGPNKNNTSGYKGVVKYKRRWIAQIKIDRRTLYLGIHLSREDAARAYDRAAVEHFGEFAWLNFPDG